MASIQRLDSGRRESIASAGSSGSFVLARSEEEVRDEIERWSGQDVASVILVDRDRRIVGWEGPKDSWGSHPDSLLNQPLESLQARLVERLGSVRAVEQRRQPLVCGMS